MWNEKTKQLVADDKLVVLGVVQEQHAERARLYKQWKQYSFPIVQDAFTGLGLAVVPVPVLIDEHGYVAKTRVRPGEIESLVAKPAESPNSPAPALDPRHVNVDWLKANSKGKPTIEFSIAMGDALIRSNSARATKEAIGWYRSSAAALVGQADMDLMGLVQFRTGVAYRLLFDQADPSQQDPADFSNASAAWSRALESNPNQYIWRRRIQQYGPRQIKPYPFYDWVETAQKEIKQRGESPVQLAVPLSGAEIAQPGRRFETVAATEKNPDPNAKITKDNGELIRFSATVVPQEFAPGKSVRVHLRFDPGVGKWSNESEEMLVWINESKSGNRSASRLVHPNAKESSSSESRTLEFEFETSQDADQGFEITGYAVFNVCKTDDGQCLYRRQDFTIPIEVTAKR